VRTLLRNVAALAKGTGIVFDYAIAPHLLTTIERGVYDAFARRVEAAGEPWICAFEPDALASDLRSYGFTTVDDLDGAQLNERYFRDRTDGLRVGTLAHVVCASNR
jgi:O-methyltransferase involved in polyketide biosynthesis